MQIASSRRPERFGPAAAVEAFLVPFRDDFVTATRAFVWLMFPAGSDPALVDQVAEDMSAAPPAVALGALRHAISNDHPMLACLKRLTAPLVAINPDYRPTDIYDLARHGVRTVLMPEVGHFLMLEDPATFNRLLAETIETFST